MGWDRTILQQIRNRVLGNPDGPFTDLADEVYLQQIIQALLGETQVGPYGNLHRRIYLERIRDLLTNVLATYPKGQLLKTGQTISYGSGTGLDDGALQKGIAKSYTLLSSGPYAGTTNITVNSKTEAKSNACALDNNTGLMWCNTLSATVGPANDGKLPWTTTGSGGTAEGIFPYVAAANAAGLAGYSDWRIPNINEALSIADYAAPTGIPNATAFPGWPANPQFWTSTTATNAGTYAFYMYIGDYASDTIALKTSTQLVLLVRGG